MGLFNAVLLLMSPLGLIKFFQAKTPEKKTVILRRNSIDYGPLGASQAIVHLTMSQRFQIRTKIISTLLAKKKQAQKVIAKRKQMQKKTK